MYEYAKVFKIQDDGNDCGNLVINCLG